MKMHQLGKGMALYACVMGVIVVVAGCSSPEARKQKAYDRGRALMESGETKKAILEFRNAIQIEPKFTDARYYLGLCLLKEKNAAAALSEFERVEKEQPARIDELKPYKAEASVGAGKYADGHPLLEELIKSSPENAGYHDLLSRAALGLSQPAQNAPLKEGEPGIEDRMLKEASAEAEKAILLDSKLVEPHMTLAQVVMRRHSNPAAPSAFSAEEKNEMARQLDAAKANAPGDIDLGLRIAELWAFSGDIPKAMSEVDAILTAAPTTSESRLLKAELLMESGKTDEAKVISQKLVEEKVGSPRLDFLNGRILFEEGEYDKAREAFRKIKGVSSADYFFALCLDKLGDHQHAMSQFEEVLDHDPTFEAARRTVFGIYLNENNLAKATVHAEAAVKAAAGSPLGYLLRARVCEAKGDWAAAHQALDDAQGFAPHLLEASMLRAEVYRKEGKLQESKELLDEVVRGQPNNVAGYLARSEVSLFLKDVPGAEADAKKALELAPKDPSAQEGFARVCLAKSDLNGASGAFEKALELAPKDLSALVGYARVCLAKSDLNRAFGAFEKALELAPDNAQVRMFLVSLCAVRKEYDKGLALLRAIDEKDPLYVEARMRMAEFLDAKGDTKAASDEFTKLVASHPEVDDVTFAFVQHFSKSDDLNPMENLAKATIEKDPEASLGHLMLSEVHAVRGQWGLAADETQLALKKSPNSARVWYRLAVLKASAGQMNEALEASSRARKLAPDLEAAVLLNAKMLAQTGKGDDALELCQKALAERPNDLMANITKADIQMFLGKYADAESAYRNQIDLHKSVLLPYLRLAALYERDQQNGGNAKAKQVFDEATLAIPNSAQLFVEYGRFWERSKDGAQARQQYARALELTPNDQALQDALARLSAAAGDFPDAEKRLREQLEKKPGELGVRLNLALVLEKEGKVDEATKLLLDFIIASQDPTATGMEISKLLASSRQFDKIERLATTMIQSDALSWMPHYVLGVAYDGERKLEQAQKEFREAATLNPKSPLAKHAEGVMCARSNRQDDALAAFEAARQIDSHFLPAYTDAAVLQFRKGSYDRVEELCRKALEVEPTSVKPALILASAYIRSNQTSLANQIADDLLKRDAKLAVPVSSLADLLLSVKLQDDAIELCQKCLAASPNTPFLVMKLGTVYEQAGKRDLAISQYAHLIEMAPTDAMAHNNIAWLLSQQGRLDEALTHARRANELRSDDPSIQDTLGMIYLGKGDREKGLPYLENSAKGAPKNPEILFHLGKAYAEMGRKGEAKPLLAKALELNANFSGAVEAKKLLDSK